MGKIRVKTIGEEEQKSKKDLKKEQAMAEAQKAKEAAAARHEASDDTTSEEQEEEVKPAKKEEAAKKTVNKTKSHSESYTKVASQVEKNKQYSLTDALPLLSKVQRTKFDETVELHINTLTKGISGNVTLPHGTGKETKVVIANVNTEPKKVDDLVKDIEAGKIDFDVLVATPETMPKLAKVARVLGPRGLMPNPKNGTVTPKPDEIAKKFAGGQISYKTEGKFPILHMAVGKISFGDKKLAENIKIAIDAIKTKNIKNITLTSTMGPGIRLDTNSLN